MYHEVTNQRTQQIFDESNDVKKLTSRGIILEVKEHFLNLNYGAVMLSQVSIFMPGA